MSGITLDQLREHTRGMVIDPEDPEDPAYDEARKVYNAMIDVRPAAVVRCANAGDVVAAVRLRARERGWTSRSAAAGTACRASARPTAPSSSTCRRCSGVTVDDAARTARPGRHHLGRLQRRHRSARARDDRRHHLHHRRRRADPRRRASATCAAAHGLSCDNLLSADVVTADGAFVTASEDENADLFWALRGGGGNFGVVTAFTFRLHPVTTIYGGPMFFELSDGAGVLRFFRDFIADAPRGVRRLPGLPDRAAAAVHAGGPARRAVRRARLLLDRPADEGERRHPAVPRRRPAGRRARRAMPYPALNSAFDALVPPGLQHYWKAAS